MCVIGNSSAWRCARFCLLLLALACAGVARAGEVEDLYEELVPVAGQGEPERLNAVRAAFEQVLVKVTGDNRAETLQRLQSLAQSPLRYVQQYLYRPLPSGFVPAVTAAARPTQMLWVRFDAQAINLFLQQANEPVWGRMRPTTLLWLAVEDEGGRYLVASDTHVDLHADIEDRAQRRGIPLLFPLLDLEDQRRASFADVWGGFEREVQEASARYQAGAVLVGRVYREAPARWAGRWSLYQDNGVEHWQTGGVQRSEVLADGIDGAADLLAARFARTLNADMAVPVDMLIKDIDRLEDYSRTMNYLKSLDAVGGLQVTRIDDAGVHFHLTLRSDRGSLVQAIGFGSVLSPAPVAASADQELAYRLLP